MSIVLDGKAHAKKVQERLKVALTGLRDRGVVPGLHVIVVGEDPASQIYVRSKARRAEAAGIRSEITRLPAGTRFEEMRERIAALNEDPGVDGILVQLPIPGLPERRVLDLVSAQKDVDGFHPENLGLLAQRRPGFVPCTPLGILSLLDAYEIPLEGRRALVIGRSEIVGRPMALLLQHRNATVTVAHSRTCDLPGLVASAEILVAAMGRRELVKASWMRPGVVVVDVGIHRKEDGRLTGDVDPEGLSERASAYTPVPGGVGPMTIATLLVNTASAALRRRRMPVDVLEDLIPKV